MGSFVSTWTNPITASHTLGFPCGILTKSKPDMSERKCTNNNNPFPLGRWWGAISPDRKGGYKGPFWGSISWSFTPSSLTRKRAPLQLGFPLLLPGVKPRLWELFFVPGGNPTDTVGPQSVKQGSAGVQLPPFSQIMSLCWSLTVTI